MSKPAVLRTLDDEFEEEDKATKEILNELDTAVDRLLLIGMIYKAAVVALLSLILWRVW